MQEVPEDATAGPVPQGLSWRWWSRWYTRGVIYVVSIYLLWCVVVFLMQGRLMFPASMAGPIVPGLPGAWQADAVVLAGAGGGERGVERGGEGVTGWLLPAPQASVGRPAPLVVYCHGNAELIDHQQRVVDAYHAMGVSVLLPEYRGYGRSGGTPSQKALVADAVGFLDQVLIRDDIDADRLMIHGRSLGGAVAAQVAAQRPPAALILESTFTHVGAFAWKFGVPPVLVRYPFNTRRVLAGLDVPVLLFHGTADDIIPVAHGRKLHDRAPDSTFITYDTDHNNFPGSGNERAFWGEVEGFLGRNGVIHR